MSATSARYIDRSRTALIDAPIVIAGDRDGIGVQMALWRNDTHAEQVLCFTSTLRQRDGGTHLAGFRAALIRAIAEYAAVSEAGDSGRTRMVGNDICGGLTAVLSVDVPDPAFSGSTRDELVLSDVEAVVERVVASGLAAWVDEHRKQASAILAKVRRAASARAVCDFVLRPPSRPA